MAWTPYQAILAVVMVVTGSINTLSTSWADGLKASHNCQDSSNPHCKGPEKFDHPFFQALFMFFGEFLCLVTFKILYFYYKRRMDGSIYENDLVKGNQEFNPLIFLPAAMFDMIGTSVMYVGLTMTYASSFQMLRGAVIIFVAILSIMFLQRRLLWKQWLGIVFVIAGLTIVGLSDFFDSSSDKNHSTNDIVTGDILIILAQISTAIQMVYEEKYVAGKDIPALQAVGWEGLFGMLVLGVLLIPFYYIPVPWVVGNPRGVMEDVPDAIYQLGQNYLIIIASIGTVVSIAFFNFAGISVTKELSATTRMILDSIRTFFIWMASLGLKWQKFEPLQVPGFIILLLGMCVYNDLLPSWRKITSICQREEQEEVLTTADHSEKRDEIP